MRDLIRQGFNQCVDAMADIDKQTLDSLASGYEEHGFDTPEEYQKSDLLLTEAKAFIIERKSLIIGKLNGDATTDHTNLDSLGDK